MFLLFFICLFHFCDGYKIVIFAPNIANSQVMFNKRVSQTLAEAGHDVTIAFSSVFEGRNNTDVKIDKNVKIYFVNSSIGIRKDEVEAEQSKIIFENLSPMDERLRIHFTRFMGMLTDSCRVTLKNKEFMNWLLHEKFDIAFTHPYHACPIGLIHYAKIPTWIWLQSGHLMDFVSSAVGVPLIPSYVPPIMLDVTDEMNFVERAKSLLMHVAAGYFWSKMITDKETLMFREELDANFPDLMDLARECPLVMVNSNEFYELSHPMLAKIVNIGGIGAQKKDAQALPENFEKIANTGKGVVLISFGSVAPSHLIPEHWKNALLGAFKRLSDYQFVFRYEGKDLTDKVSPNVHLVKWMPQADLLQHKNTKAFLTHGGYNSLQEAINAGKPLVTIGLFGDQPKNEKIAKKHGFAINLSKGNITSDSVYESLKEIIENPSYMTKSQRLADMVACRPVPPSQLLVKWTEFVAEFKTLENLVPASQKLNFFQYHSLDVIGAILAVFVLIFFISYKLFSCIISLICCRKVKKEKLN